MNGKIYDKKVLNIIKNIVLVGFVILIFAGIRAFVSLVNIEGNKNWLDYWVPIEDSSVALIFVVLFFNPQKIELIAFIAFLYAIPLPESVSYVMCFDMFVLGIVVLVVRGYFINHKKQKILICVLFFLGQMILVGLFSSPNSLSAMLDILGHAFVIFCILAFIFIFLYKEESKKEKILNLATVNGAKEYDVDLLQQILNGTPYKQLNLPENMAPGTVRSHVSRLLKKIGVIDKTGFIASYTGYKIVYEKISDEADKSPSD